MQLRLRTFLFSAVSPAAPPVFKGSRYRSCCLFNELLPLLLPLRSSKRRFQWPPLKRSLACSECACMRPLYPPAKNGLSFHQSRFAAPGCHVAAIFYAACSAPGHFVPFSVAHRSCARFLARWPPVAPLDVGIFSLYSCYGVLSLLLREKMVRKKNIKANVAQRHSILKGLLPPPPRKQIACAIRSTL